LLFPSSSAIPASLLLFLDAFDLDSSSSGQSSISIYLSRAPENNMGVCRPHPSYFIDPSLFVLKTAQ